MLIPSSIAGQTARCAGGPNVVPLALPSLVPSGLDIIQHALTGASSTFNVRNYYDYGTQNIFKR